MDKDKLYCIKLVTGEEVVGILNKLYSDGDIKLENVMMLVPHPSTAGYYLERYLIAGINDGLEFRSSAIITHSPANQIVIDLFTKTIMNEDETGQTSNQVN
jgi:hypothetical protein